MGTRRSRHNKGRKPVYKDYRNVANNLLKWKKYGGSWLDKYTTWQDVDLFKLSVFCEAEVDVEAAADAIGRPPSSLCHRARDDHLILPQQWSRLITPKRKRKRVLTEKTSQLAYPYITNVRPEHADLLTINALIPKSIPDNMRADMCQEIMLALLEGRTTIEALKSRDRSPAYFMRKFYKDNFEQSGHALSFNVEDDERSYDEVASAVAAKEWHHGQVVERHRYVDAMTQTFTPPTQFEAAWQDQVGRVTLNLHQMGQFLSRDEVEAMLDEQSQL